MSLGTCSINVSHSLRHTLPFSFSLHYICVSTRNEHMNLKQQQKRTQDQREVQTRRKKVNKRDGRFQKIERGDGPFKSFRFNKCLAQGHIVGPSQLHWPILRTVGGVWMVGLVKDSTSRVIGEDTDVETVTIPHKTLSTRAQKHKHKLCSTTYSSTLPT